MELVQIFSEENLMRPSFPPSLCGYFSHDEMRNVWSQESQVTHDSEAGDQRGECHQANKRRSLLRVWEHSSPSRE